MLKPWGRRTIGEEVEFGLVKAIPLIADGTIEKLRDVKGIENTMLSRSADSQIKAGLKAKADHDRKMNAKLDAETRPTAEAAAKAKAKAETEAKAKAKADAKTKADADAKAKTDAKAKADAKAGGKKGG